MVASVAAQLTILVVAVGDLLSALREAADQRFRNDTRES